MWRLSAILVLWLVGCVEGEVLQIPDHDGGWDADSFVPDSSADADAPEPDADVPDAEPPIDSEPPPCNVFAWPDADGDGFGDENAEPVEACDGVPHGYVTNGDDCYDENPEAFPGQTKFFISSQHRGDGSYDYNCDGVEELERTAMANSPVVCADGVPLGDMPGWFITCPSPDATYTYCLADLSPPGCGERASWYRDTCGGGSVKTWQGCR